MNIKKLKVKMRAAALFIPVVLIFFTFLSAFIDMDNVIASNLVGYSVLVNSYFICYHSFNKRYCYITRIAPIGLILVNFVDIIGCFINYEFYKFIFTFVISSFAIGIGVYYDLNKRIKR